MKTQQEALRLLNRAQEFSFDKDGIIRTPVVQVGGKELVLKKRKHLVRYLEQFPNSPEGWQ